MLYQNMQNYQPLQRREHSNVSRHCKITFITNKPLTRLLPTLSRNIPRNSVLSYADLFTHRGGVFLLGSLIITANCLCLMLPNQHCFLPLPL